VYNG